METQELIVKQDPHSYARSNESKVTHLSMNLAFEKKILKGKATLTIQSEAGANKIHLDTKDLNIEKITLNDSDTPAKFTLGNQDRFLGKELIIEIDSTTKFITINYSTSPGAAALQWLSPQQTAGKKQPFLFTQSQAILARTWVPIQDSPGIRFTYEAVIQVPKQLMAAMSAENPQQKNDSGIYHFTMPKPIPAYLLALAVGDFLFKPLDARTGVYAEQVTIDKAIHDFWMNEGFTVYFELRIMEELYGKDFSDMQCLLGLEDLKATIAELGDTSADTHLKLNLAGRDPDDGMNDIAYEKGHFLLLLIEKTIGRDRFDVFLKNYFHSHAFGTITTEQFLKEYNSELIKGNSELEQKININEWVYKPGLPKNCPIVHSAKFEAVAKEVEVWKNNGKAKELNTNGYSTYEWLRFLALLPEKLSSAQMKDLDETFHFTKTGNSEILFAWLEKCIYSNYEPAFPTLKVFLTDVGRRKFVKPLFSAMIKTESGRKMAENIYSSSRENYHTITQMTIDSLLVK